MVEREKYYLPESSDDRTKIAELIDSLKFEEGFEFEYDDIDHQVLLCDENEEQGSPVEYTRSTGIAGYDIYIWESMPETWKKVAMMHEIKEINLITKVGWDKVKAHWEARKLEDEYGHELLGEEEFKKYIDFRNQYEDKE